MLQGTGDLEVRDPRGHVAEHVLLAAGQLAHAADLLDGEELLRSFSASASDLRSRPAALRGLPELFDEVARRNRAKQVAVRLKADGPHELAGTVSRAHHHHDARGGLAGMISLKIKRRVLLGSRLITTMSGPVRKGRGPCRPRPSGRAPETPRLRSGDPPSPCERRRPVHEHDRDQLAPVHSNHL